MKSLIFAFIILLMFSTVHADTEPVFVPVLLYHNLEQQYSGENTSTVSVEKFEKDLATIREAGYTPIFFDELSGFLEGKNVLPQKPIIITFDDGYASNYEYAYPLLKKYRMKAEIFIIGWNVGKHPFMLADTSIIPHFSWKQAKEMVDSGRVKIQSHTYDLHNPEGQSFGLRFNVGIGCQPLKGELTPRYETRLDADLKQSIKNIKDNIGAA
ncbi:MAG: polysaccharide deacetylase family protein, partial [Caulobacteraceae bacterium]